MAASLKGISARGWLRLARWTVFGTLVCLAVSVAYNWVMFRNLEPEALRQSIISAIVLPVVLAGPLFFFLSVKLRELAIVNRRLFCLASLDGLTGCLNRRAFTGLVEQHLQGGQPGALLMVEADHFKAVNDRFGHDVGDEALRTIAAAIRSALRSGDAVGRLGGEEFGVYLPKAGDKAALEVAERVRTAVAAAIFVPSGKKRHRLSISVGCATHEGPMGYRDLFSLADKSLYAAKKRGRNRVELAITPTLAPEAGDMMMEAR